MGREGRDVHARPLRRHGRRTHIGASPYDPSPPLSPRPVYRAIRPLLFHLDPETAHTATLALAAAVQCPLGPVLARRFTVEDARLAQTVLGRRIAAPVGVAAGLDKNARLIPMWAALGFGWAEVGSATARPSDGNPRPRMWRLPEAEALVNRMGLNNEGAAAIARRIARVAPSGTFAGPGARRVPVGVNIAKTHDPAILGDDALDDFRASFAAVAPHAAWVTLNVSCPNTREGTTFEDPRALDALLTAVMAERARVAPAVPLLVKLAPPPAASGDATAAQRLRRDRRRVRRARRRGLRGGQHRARPRGRVAGCRRAGRAGGLSGAPLAARSRRLVRHLFRATNGAVPIVATGGIATPDGAYAAIRAGATLAGVYTGLVYHGPALARDLHRGLLAALDRDRLATIADAVGADT